MKKQLRSKRWKWWSVSTLALCAPWGVMGCFSSPEPSLPSEIPQAPGLGVFRLVDGWGNPWPAAAAPQWPTLEMPWSGDPQLLPADGVLQEHLFLFEGLEQSAAHADLQRTPVLISHQALRVDSAVMHEDGKLRLRPNHRLKPGVTYVFGVAQWLPLTDGSVLGEPWTQTLHISEDEKAGSTWVDSWPPELAPGVPTELERVVLQFTGPLELPQDPGDSTSGIQVTQFTTTGTETKRTVPTHVHSVDCVDWNWNGGHCVALEFAQPLGPATDHAVRVNETLLDGTGAPVGPLDVRFRTGATPKGEPLHWVAPSCADDETPLMVEDDDGNDVEVGCALVRDVDLALRAAVSGPARVTVRVAPVGTGSPNAPTTAFRTTTLRDVAPRGEFRFSLDGLAPDTDYGVTVEVTDMAERVTSTVTTIRTLPPLPALYITEVRSNPAGPEPDQEYVEILNGGTTPISLFGMRITDDPGRTGDLLPPLVLPAGARALVVDPDFDPTHPKDVAVPAGVPLLRLTSSIGSSGLTNAGEPVILRDGDGHRLHAWQGAASDNGLCLGPAETHPLPATNTPLVDGPCTPGW